MVYCCSLPIWRRSPLEKEPLIDLFLANCPALDLPLGGVCRKSYTQVRDYVYFISIKFRKHLSSGSVGWVVMVHNPAHDLSSIGHFLCRVRVVDCCDLRNGAEWQWIIVATISGNFFLLKSLLVGTTTVMHRYGPNDTYPCVSNMKRTIYPYLLADFYDAPQFEMINFANVNIEHYNSDPVISLFWKYANHVSIYGIWRHMHKLNIYKPYKCYKNLFINDHSCSVLLYTTNCNPKRHQSVQISKSFGLQPVTIGKANYVFQCIHKHALVQPPLPSFI